jgi:hypothetical protein
MLLHTIERGKYARVVADRVVYIEASGQDKTTLHMTDKRMIAVRGALGLIAAKFPTFSQAAKYCFVNPDHVYSVRLIGLRVHIKFGNGEKLEVGRSKKFYKQFLSSL